MLPISSSRLNYSGTTCKALLPPFEANDSIIPGSRFDLVAIKDTGGGSPPLGGGEGEESEQADQSPSSDLPELVSSLSRPPYPALAPDCAERPGAEARRRAKRALQGLLDSPCPPPAPGQMEVLRKSAQLLGSLEV